MGSDRSPSRYDFNPWKFFAQANEDERAAQRAWQAVIAERGDVRLGEPVFISPLASVYPDRLSLGRHSYLAAHSYLTGDVEMGENCTLNPFALARGTLRCGAGVRIGAHAMLLGFNHSMAPDRPVYQQPVTSEGIAIGDDVWIGSNAVVLDGVTVGDHCVIGASAVVTKDVPAWAVVAGNPARPIRDRRGGTRGDLGERLERFAERARGQAADVLARCWDGERFVDRPGAGPTVRAWCDAVEISDLLLGGAPPRAGVVAELLRSWQDPATGLVPELGGREPTLAEPALYHILCVGYALRLLGSGFAHPVRAVADLDAPALVDRLERLPWNRRGWSAGAWVDAIGTALYWNRADFGLGGAVETLFGWLLTRCDPWHGMWGSPDEESGWLQVVNGCYRLTRGTFAQFGLPLPYPERTVDTVLAHSADPTRFRDELGNACNVLDVIHPLWLCGRQSTHRRGEGAAWARWQLERALRRWRDGAGFGFDLEPGAGPRRTPGLQGTEMWLAIVWLLADYLGESEALGYRPRGVHRPGPAMSLRPSDQT